MSVSVDGLRHPAALLLGVAAAAVVGMVAIGGVFSGGNSEPDPEWGSGIVADGASEPSVQETVVTAVGPDAGVGDRPVLRVQTSLALTGPASPSTAGPSAAPSSSAPAVSDEPSTTSASASSETTPGSTTTRRSTTTRASTGSTASQTTATTTPTTGATTTTSAVTTTATPTTTNPTTTSTSTTTTTSTTVTGGSERVVWQEDFNALDPSVWRVEHSTYGDGNNELQCYRPENVSVSGGRLVLKAVAETYTCPNGSRRQHTSGMIRSRGVTFSPGQSIEFRVKLTPADRDDQAGLWPAVWSSSWAGGGWPRGGELDYLEVMTAENPRRAMFSMHYQDSSGRHELQNKGVIGNEYFSDRWHTIRFDYGTGGRLTWYLDGVEAFSVDAADTVQGYPAPFDQRIDEIKVNLALGGRPGPLSPGALGSLGATFEVDYIRIIER